MNFPGMQTPTPSKNCGAFKVPSPKKKNPKDTSLPHHVHTPQPQSLLSSSLPPSIFYLNYFNQILLQSSAQSQKMISLLQDEHSICSNLSTASAFTEGEVVNMKQLKVKCPTCPSVDKNSRDMQGKRKRKSERDLTVLREELKKELMWSRDKISQLSERLSMSETQIYKWWWD